MPALPLFLLGSLLSVSLLCGCATAIPLLGGGSTTPRHRKDFAVGGTARVVSKGLRKTETRETPPAGVVPVGSFRMGLPSGWDLGGVASGTALRVDARHEWVIREASTRPVWLAGASLILGAVEGRSEGENAADDRLQEDKHVLRSGFELPFLYAVEFGGLYEVWGGIRAGLDHFSGTALTSNVVLRTGAVLGISSGFRYVHAGLECIAEYEHHFADGPDLDGLALTPAFFVRLRL